MQEKRRKTKVAKYTRIKNLKISYSTLNIQQILRNVHDK